MVKNHIIGTILFLLVFYAPQSMAAGTAKNLKCKGCVGTKDLANKAVTGRKIRNGAVNFDKLGPDVQVILDIVDSNDARITSNASNIAINSGEISSILSRFPVLLPTYMLSRTPTNVDDRNSEVPFPRGTIVVNTVSKQVYISADDTPGLAVWLSLTPKTYKIGDNGPAGGIVFHTTDGGIHGLEAQTFNAFFGPWGCVGAPPRGATNRSVGSGERNTATIVFSCQDLSAAGVVYDNTYDGYSDWYLPSIDELALLYAERFLPGLAGGFEAEYYWSSSRSTSTPGFALAWSFIGVSDSALQFPSNEAHAVRAIRSF
jgi:hypothetical protein